MTWDGSREMEFMALKGSTKLLDQTHVMSKSYPMIPHLYSEAKENAATSNSKEDTDRPQGRRPALGRKRAQFSLNPTSSHSLPTIDINSSVDHIEDPEKYFLAYEQHENADKELKKLRGEVATDVAQNQHSRTARERRPSILGKMTSYRDRFSVNTIEAFRVPEEVSPDRRICSQSVAESSIYSHSEANEKPSTSHATGTNGEHFDVTEGEGFVVNKESEVHNLLDNLLSQFKDSDEGDVEKLLSKTLEIHSINAGKIHLTELGSTQRNGGRPLDNRCTIKLNASQLPRGSLTHTRSPLSLQRRISLKNPLEDPYSLPFTDDEPTSGDFCISTGQDKQPFSPSEDMDYHNNACGVPGDGSSTLSAMNEKSSSGKGKIGSLVPGADKTGHKNIPSEEEHAKSCSHETNAAHNSSRFKNHRPDASTERDVCLEEKENDKQPDDLSYIQPQPEVKDLAAGYANQNNTENLASSSSRNTDLDAGSFGLHGIAHRKVNAMAEGELVSPPEISRDKSSPSRNPVLLDGHSKNSSILTGENDEAQRLEEASGGSRNRGKIKRGSRKRPSKETSISKREKTRGRSLAGFGSKLESGVRRSTRYKHRPLEFWRGERFLYGRILDSLATVIGVKTYVPPAKGVKDPVLKVESLVDEKYADLVAKSGLY